MWNEYKMPRFLSVLVVLALLSLPHSSADANEARTYILHEIGRSLTAGRDEIVDLRTIEYDSSPYGGGVGAVLVISGGDLFARNMRSFTEPIVGKRIGSVFMGALTHDGMRLRTVLTSNQIQVVTYDTTRLVELASCAERELADAAVAAAREQVLPTIETPALMLFEQISRFEIALHKTETDLLDDGRRRIVLPQDLARDLLANDGPGDDRSFLLSTTTRMLAHSDDLELSVIDGKAILVYRETPKVCEAP